ncbi:MAG: aldose 1-epimerase family protein [Actinomycetota bacterium]|nr:aldose 1-epimerase family protein [Actinomycetota bacterium]
MTGGQYELRHDDQVVVVDGVGAGLRRYALGDWEVVDGYPAGARPDGARGQLLAPWPNRIRDGRYRWGDELLQLELTEPQAGNAIHGLVRELPFSLRDWDGESVVLGVALEPQPGYPFRLDLEVSYALTDAGLAVEVIARNLGERPAPYAVGQHPYLQVGTERVDAAVLTVPADRWLETDDRGIPMRERSVDGATLDFRHGRLIGTQALDTAFCGLRYGDSGIAVARLARPDGSRVVDLRVAAPADYLQIYTGDTLPDRGRRRRSVAIEAMSAPANAFNSDPAGASLAPGTSHELRWGISPSIHS